MNYFYLCNPSRSCRSISVAVNLSQVGSKNSNKKIRVIRLEKALHAPTVEAPIALPRIMKRYLFVTEYSHDCTIQLMRVSNLT